MTRSVRLARETSLLPVMLPMIFWSLAPGCGTTVSDGGDAAPAAEDADGVPADDMAPAGADDAGTTATADVPADDHCSRNAMVTVCHSAADAGALDAGRSDAGTPTDGGPPPDRGPLPRMDAGPPSPIGPSGGTVDLMFFGSFGDMRPPAQNSLMFPAAVLTSVIDGLRSEGVQFAVSTGDYMFATTASVANAQTDILLPIEAGLGAPVFRAMGNHECLGASASNCPGGRDSPAQIVYRTRLAPGYANAYFDWVIHTSLGDAHFIATAPNAWSPAQQTWLTRALAQAATYTIVIAHEPPGNREAPGTPFIEQALQARGNVTLRLYGHTHEYAHPVPNGIVTGNAGAPLAPGASAYGFATIRQRADGNLVVSAFDVGHPPMMRETFVLTPHGALTR